MEKFSDFISEQKNEQPYRVICFYHADNLLQDTPVNNHLEMMSVMNNASKKSGVEIHYADYVGSYLSEKNGKTILHSLSIDWVISLSLSKRTSIICSGKIYGLFLSRAFFSVSWKISAAFSEKGKLINT